MVPTPSTSSIRRLRYQLIVSRLGEIMSGIVINILDVIVDLLLDFTRYTLQIVRFIISKIGAGIFYDVMSSFS